MKNRINGFFKKGYSLFKKIFRYDYQINECRSNENKLDEKLLQKMKKQAEILLEHDTNLFEQCKFLLYFFLIFVLTFL